MLLPLKFSASTPVANTIDSPIDLHLRTTNISQRQEDDLYETTYDDYDEDEEENEERARLYVGDLQGDITKEMLMEVFGPYGDVIDIWIARNPKGVLFVMSSLSLCCCGLFTSMPVAFFLIMDRSVNVCTPSCQFR